MLSRCIKKYIRLSALQEECRKIGTNFITAGIVGIFINHYVGSNFSTMFWAAIWISGFGLVLLTAGLFRFGDNK